LERWGVNNIKLVKNYNKNKNPKNTKASTQQSSSLPHSTPPKYK
jgi:hypothetical protein